MRIFHALYLIVTVSLPLLVTGRLPKKNLLTRDQFIHQYRKTHWYGKDGRPQLFLIPTGSSSKEGSDDEKIGENKGQTGFSSDRSRHKQAGIRTDDSGNVEKRKDKSSKEDYEVLITEPDNYRPAENKKQNHHANRNFRGKIRNELLDDSSLSAPLARPLYYFRSPETGSRKYNANRGNRPWVTFATVPPLPPTITITDPVGPRAPQRQRRINNRNLCTRFNICGRQ